MGRKHKIDWNDEAIGYLRSNYKDMTYEEMARHFDVSVSTIGSRCRQYGFVTETKRRNCADWTKERLDYLIENFPTVSISDIADHIGISCSCVSTKARELGLKKSADWSKNLYRNRYVKNYRHMEVAR